jgi:NADH:ubiquinone reductase (non-electrogenic)
MINYLPSELMLLFVMLSQKGGDFKFWEAECFKIDPAKKKIHCRSNTGTNLDGNGEFLVDYDYLVVAVGARSNTFNTPGVEENCHFLKVRSHMIYVN